MKIRMMMIAIQWSILDNQIENSLIDLYLRHSQRFNISLKFL